MNPAFSINSLQSPTEVAVAWQAVENYRRSQNIPLPQNPDPGAGQIDPAVAELAQRIYKGLTMAPLGPRYKAMMDVWLAAPAGHAVTVVDLAKKVGCSDIEMRASLSKLSARMKRIATPQEAASLRTPFMLLAEIEYDETNSSRHTLTPAGREAARKYLAR
jgi:hypothetical protein